MNHVQAVGLVRVQAAGEKAHLNTHPSAGAAHCRLPNYELVGEDLLSKRASDVRVDASHYAPQVLYEVQPDQCKGEDSFCYKVPSQRQ